MPNEKDNNESIQQELHATRKVGLPRYFEMVGRDLWAFYRAGFLCAVGFLPGAVLLWFGLMGGSALYSLLGGLLAGLIGAPFVIGMIDTVLRSLRDEPGYWWHTYRRAWKQNWRQSLVPGALLGLFLGGWGWLLRTMLDGRFAANPSATLWVVAVVSIFICTGFLVWLLVQVPLLDLPLGQLAKNAALMFFGFFPRTLAAALLLLVYWGLTLLYMPYTIPVLLLFSFWLPVSAAVMILYPALDKAFKLEETLAARRDAELDDYMADNDR